jgi:hypothetical protein
LILSAAAFAVMSPFLTKQSIGGVVAFWYANMIRGVTDQIAAGHFPVPVGEGPFAWNGGVHPFRTAPVYPMLAAAWYIVTLGKLGEFSLQNLTAITSALIGTLGFYVAAAKIMPNRKWAACGFALLYLAAPSWLAVLVNVEDYMSYMVFAAMPLVLYGNARSVLEADGRGYLTLGAGLALVWMCHPPIALLTSIATIFIQAGAAVSRGFAPWKGMLGCAAVFAVLSAYYFVSMSELPRAAQQSPMLAEVLLILGLAIFFVGLGRIVFHPRDLACAACIVLGAIEVGHASKPWLVWISASFALWIVVIACARWTRSVDLQRHSFAAIFVCALLGSAAAEVITGPANFLAANTSYLPGLLRPLPSPFQGLPLLQLGWGLDLALAAGALSLFGRRPVGAKAFFAVSVGLFICFVRVPLVSDFLVGYFPLNLASMSGFPLGLRITPVIASFCAMSGVLWVATLPERSRAHGPICVALAVLVAWSGYQAARFVDAGHRLTASAAQDAKSTRPENLALSRYAYDLMRLPEYYSNGVADPHLESRFLNDEGDVILGPEQAAQVLEAKGVRSVRLTCKPSTSPGWFEIVPKLTIEPGEHVLLRFKFDPARTYNGYLIMTAEDSYREYHLPDSGMSKAFGIGGSRTSVLSLWNSGNKAETYGLEMSREAANDIDINGGLFANLLVSEFDPQALPIRLESLIPYRVSTDTKTGGWLETFLLYLPGYHAWIDGIPALVAKSAEALAEVKVPPGKHTVEIRFVGTRRLWASALLSAAGWMMLLVFGLRSVRR